ncbi:MAG: DUF11 domain-containing protein [Acidobacteriia bacterium]|nr:DUF11 domain-containing protein [Terriglobia bacterium]
MKSLNAPDSCAATRAANGRELWRIALAALLLVLSAFLFPSEMLAQGKYVYVNHQDVANSISAFSVSSTGALTKLPGSPYATGGVGATATCYGVDRITISGAANLLFVSNSGDQTISAMKIDATTGALTAAPGSPFASGLTLDSCQGISLAATPDGHFLMASANGQIRTFAIAADGSLSLVDTTANCCSPMVGMKISSNGKFLATANSSSASVFAIHADGSLTAVAGSPFPKTGTGFVSGLEFSCAVDRLYGAEASFGTSALVDAWTVAADGSLTALPGSPFSNTGTDVNSLVLSPDNAALFESGQFSDNITTSSVNSDGSLAGLGNFAGTGFLHVPVGIATDASGSLLYAADDGFGVAVLSINGANGLTKVVDVAISTTGTIQGLAAYPPRKCANADLAITLAASPTTVAAGSNVTYTVSVANNGPDAASATIADTLPAGTTLLSCAATGAGACSPVGQLNPHLASFPSIASGTTETVTLVAQTSVTLVNGTTLTDTASISNKSAVDSNLANNTASASVTISAQPGSTTLTVSPATGSFGGLAVLSATLRRSNGTAVAGKTVTFSFNGAVAGTAVTNNIGQAILTISVAGTPLGVYPGAISASFAGDAAFAPSTGLGDLTVNKAVLTIIPSSTARVYGDPNPASFPYNISGFLNGDTAAVVSGTTTCSTAATVLSPVGHYPITCTLGTLSAANYTFALLPGTLQINPAPLTVTADNATRLYGDANPVFTGTLVGFKNGDVFTATYSTPATTASPVGTYLIVPLVAASPLTSNYTITYVNGTLTITPAPLSVTANSATRVYGDANPAFTGAIVGIRNGDAITATYSSPATPASPVGTYPIIPTLLDPAGKLPNYTVTITDGVLTITPAPLTVTAASASRVYGNANPVFTGTIVGLRNGDAITATYSSPATVTSDVGTYPIIPTLVDLTGKLGNYTVTSINGVLTITPAPLTFTVANASRIYGNANPAFTGTFVGIKNGDVLTVTFTTTATATSPVGTYPITPVVSGPRAIDYTIVVSGGVLTITKAPLTVTGFNGSRLYGDPNPAPTIAGLKNADPITASYTATSATAASPVGNYIMVPVVSDPAGKLSNYTLTIQNGTMTINKAPLSVVAASVSRPYGSANPALTGTITGIKNADNITATFSTTATATTNAGTAAITVTVNDPTGKLSNYNLTTANGVLTITPVPLSITASNQTVILNGSLLNSATYSGFVLGQGPANLAGNLSCSSNGSTIGTHTITCSGQSSTNYTITFVPGTETVIYAPVGNCSNGPGHQILAPIAANGSTAFTRATTTTIPIQFRVCDARGASVSANGVVTSFTLLQKITGGVTTTLNQAQSTAFTFVGGNLANGAGTQGWQLNLNTSTPTNLAAGSTYVYQIGLSDGTSITFQFSMN